MQINGLWIIDSLVAKYPRAGKPMSRWVTITAASEWNSLMEIKNAFSATDYAAPHTIFDIGGNKWRLITIVEYADRLVIVTHALTHEEYSKGRWRT